MKDAVLPPAGLAPLAAARSAAPGVPDPAARAEAPQAQARQRFGSLIRVFLSLALLAGVFAFVPIAEVFQALTRVNLAAFALALALMLASRWLMAFRMSFITTRQALSLSTFEIFKIGLMSTFYGLFLPGQMAAGAVRWYLLARKDRKAVEAASAIALSRVSDMASLALIGLGAAWWAPAGSVPAAVLWAFAALALILLASYTALIVPHATRAFLAAARCLMLLRIPLLQRGLARITASLARFHFLPLGLQLELWGLSLVCHGLDALAVYFLAAALGLDLAFVTCVWLKSFVAFLTMLPIAFHGIGVRDGAFILLLTPFGIAQADAVALSFLVLATILIMSLLGAVLVAQEVATGRAWSRRGGRRRHGGLKQGVAR